MAEGNRDSKLEGEIALRDKAIDSPSARANRVWTVISNEQQYGDLTTWDVVCFCVEYLGLISPRFPWIERAAKEIARLVYLAHYATENDDGFTAERIRAETPPLNTDRGSNTGTQSSGVVPGFVATGDELRRSSSDIES